MKHFKLPKCKNILLKGECKLQKSYTYEFRPKKEPEIEHF